MKKKSDHEKNINKVYSENAKQVSKEVSKWPDWKKKIELGFTYTTNSGMFLPNSKKGSTSR